MLNIGKTGKFMGLTKVTRNYQITLPHDIRESEHIRIGDKFIIVKEGDQIVLRRVDEDIIEKCFGAWKTKGSGVAYTKRLRAEWKQRQSRSPGKTRTAKASYEILQFSQKPLAMLPALLAHPTAGDVAEVVLIPFTLFAKAGNCLPWIGHAVDASL